MDASFGGRGTAGQRNRNKNRILSTGIPTAVSHRGDQVGHRQGQGRRIASRPQYQVSSEAFRSSMTCEGDLLLFTHRQSISQVQSNWAASAGLLRRRLLPGRFMAGGCASAGRIDDAAHAAIVALCVRWSCNWFQSLSARHFYICTSLKLYCGKNTWVRVSFCSTRTVLICVAWLRIRNLWSTVVSVSHIACVSCCCEMYLVIWSVAPRRK